MSQAETTKCPKCNANITRVWVNKRQQRHGRCDGCGKMVYLGKAQPAAGKHTGKEETPAQQTPPRKTKPAQRRSTAPARSGAGAAKQPAAGPASKRSFFDHVSEFLNRKL